MRYLLGTLRKVSSKRLLDQKIRGLILAIHRGSQIFPGVRLQRYVQTFLFHIEGIYHRPCIRANALWLLDTYAHLALSSPTMTPLRPLLVAHLKTQLASLLAKNGRIVLVDSSLSDAAVRAVAELVQERKCFDEYTTDGTLHLVVTRAGVDDK